MGCYFEVSYSYNGGTKQAQQYASGKLFEHKNMTPHKYYYSIQVGKIRNRFRFFVDIERKDFTVWIWNENFTQSIAVLT